MHQNEICLNFGIVSQNNIFLEIFTVIAEMKYANRPMQSAQTHASKM